MRIGNFLIWCSAAEAKAIGCTHTARMWGIIPGFSSGPDDPDMLWVSRSDALNWVEDLLSRIAAMVAESRGDDPIFAFKIGGPIS